MHPKIASLVRAPGPSSPARLVMSSPPHAPRRKVRGFSLVEIVLALGICSFAMVAIVGMIPVGLSTFKDAMNTTVRSQIVQSLASDVLLTSFTELKSTARYFYDDQGAQLLNADSPSLAYTAQVEHQNLTGPNERLFDANAAILIRIAKTHPGQRFEDIEEQFPNQIYSYPVIVPLLTEVAAAPVQ